MTTQVLLPVPDNVYEQAQSVAEMNGRDISDVLSQVIYWDINSLVEEPVMTEQEKREEAAFIRLHPEMREKYPEQYVAIYQEQLVDYDASFNKLHRRIRAKYGKSFVWIAPVLETPTETWTVYSNRL